MNYINPFDLLNIQSENLSDIDSSTIRRAKKKLLADIELSDNDTIDHNGIELTKSDCIRAVDDLDHKDKNEFHYFIFKNPDLNSFLNSGDLRFFKTYKSESIYKLSEFLDFISPFYIFQYDKQLSLNYKKRDIDKVKLLLSIKPITNEASKELCFKGTYTTIKEIENEIITINKNITDKKSKFIDDNFNGLADLISKKVDVELLNILPIYFQSLRNSLAQTIRNLARDINNDPFNNYKPAYEIIDIANNVSTDGLVKQTISKGYYTIKKNYENGLNKTEKDTKPSSSQVVDTKKPKKENSIVANIYLGVWFLVLTIALFHHKTQLIIIGISVSYFFYRVYFFFKEPENFKKSTTLQKIYFVGFWILGIIGFFYLYAAILFISYSIVNGIIGLLKKKDDEQSEDNSRLFMCLLISLFLSLGVFNKYYGVNILIENKNYVAPVGSINQTVTQSPNNLDTIALEKASTDTIPIVKAPTYIYQKVKNGNIAGCTSLRERYDKNIDNRLEISCGNNSSVIVKLVNFATEKSIRYVFINKNTVYVIRNIPEGKYYLKIGYGNDWAVIDGEPNCAGRFTTDAFFKKGDEILDFNLKKSTRGYQIPSFSLKLDVIKHENDEETSNFNTNNINENDFYNE